MPRFNGPAQQVAGHQQKDKQQLPPKRVEQPQQPQQVQQQPMPNSSKRVEQSHQQQHLQQQPMPNPHKKIKTEQTEPSAAVQSHQSPHTEAPLPKRPRQQNVASTGAPTPARGMSTTNFASTPNRRGDGIIWVLSEIRHQLEEISDVDGVPELIERFPICVLVGGIPAQRELVGALLGDHAIATSAAQLLISPNIRQPLALELRCGGQDLQSVQNPEAEAWLRNVHEAASQAFGKRLKVDPLRLRLSAMGCANLDVLSLPDPNNSQGNLEAPQSKLDDMRMQQLGSSTNLLVCLEPGATLELCRRFDLQQQRTVLLGAASPNMQGNPLFGLAAAQSLEERFVAACRKLEPQWLSSLQRLELRLTKAQTEARENEQRESSNEVLTRARGVGVSFARALENIISGAPGCNAGALTLEEELMEFATTAAKGQCGSSRSLSAQDATIAVADLFANFDGVEGYVNYLRNDVQIPGADVPLNGGAAWQRLLAEIEVAMRLAHPSPDQLAGLMLAAMRLGGTGTHGHQRWEDVTSKLMLSIAHEPIRLRIRYVTARIVWVLKHQKAAISEWMSTVADGPAAKLYSPLFPQHVAILRQSPMIRDFVFHAYDGAVSTVGEQVLKNLEGTLMAACINPEIMLCPSTEPVLDVCKVDAPKSRSDRSEDERKRVIEEMRKRGSPSGGLPMPLRDRVFEPSEAERTLPFVELKLRHAFAVLVDILSNHAFSFADTSLSSLCRRHVDEAMHNIEFNPEQQSILSKRHKELEEVAQQVEVRLGAVRKCITAIRNAPA